MVIFTRLKYKTAKMNERTHSVYEISIRYIFNENIAGKISKKLSLANGDEESELVRYVCWFHSSIWIVFFDVHVYNCIFFSLIYITPNTLFSIKLDIIDVIPRVLMCVFLHDDKSKPTKLVQTWISMGNSANFASYLIAEHLSTINWKENPLTNCWNVCRNETG